MRTRGYDSTLQRRERRVRNALASFEVRERRQFFRPFDLAVRLDESMAMKLFPSNLKIEPAVIAGTTCEAAEWL
jgi:hypothetical protein